jgi:hypothetical protein
VALGGGGRRDQRNSGEAGGLGQAGVGAGRSRGALGPVWEVGRGGDGAGGGVRRWQASAGTGAPALASSWSWQENGRRAQLYGILGEASGASAGSEGEWSDGSVAVGLMARWRALCCARGGPAAALVCELGRRPFIGDARLLSDEGTEYVGRGTVHRKGTPRGTSGPTWRSSSRSSTHRRTARARRGPQGASGHGRPGEGRDLGRHAARTPRGGRRGASARTFRCAHVRRCFYQKFSTKVR